MGAESGSCSIATTSTSPSRADVVFDDQSSNGIAVVVTRVTLHSGGFVAVINGTDTPGSALVLGSSEFLEPGTHTEIPVELDAPIHENRTLTAVVFVDASGDRNPDEDGSDESLKGPNGTVVADTANITVAAGPASVHEPPDTPEPTVTTHEPTAMTAREPNATATNDERLERSELTVEKQTVDASNGDRTPGHALTSEESSPPFLCLPTERSGTHL